MEFSSWQIEKGEGVLGTCILGTDLNAVSDPLTFGYVKTLLWKYRLLIFRNQLLTPRGHERFAMRLGVLRQPPLEQCVFMTNYVQRVIKNEKDHYNFGGAWHTDASFRARPPEATMLQAVELPSTGGDTLFADCVLAFETLPEYFRKRLVNISGVHRAHGVIDPANYVPEHYENDGIGNTATHPVINRHPYADNSYLYVNETFTKSLSGMSVEESKQMLADLNQHITHPARVYRHQWRSGDVLLWDNRTTQHCAINDYTGQKRVMYRTVILDTTKINNDL